MKLWYICQWGNPDDGGDGPDTNCIVRAPDLQTAIVLAQDAFSRHYDKEQWRDCKADSVYLIGEDLSPSNEPKLITAIWIAHAYNLAGYKSWGRIFDTDQWEEHEKLYPPGS